jgi:hypothetical protein
VCSSDLGVDTLTYVIDPSDHAHIKTRVLSGLAEGVLLFNYLGHGGMDRLAEENLLDATDIEAMANAENLPIVTMMTCVTGLFDIPGYDCLAESLMTNKDGMGAIAVWAPSGLSSVSNGVVLDHAFLKALYENRNGTLGDTVLKAIKAYVSATKDTSMADVFILFGDPALTPAQ